MCGRYTRKYTWREVREFLDLVFAVPEMPASYNVAPTQSIPIVRLRETGERELALARWGLVPAWSKAPASGPPLFNARSETIADKPAFRSAFRARRCVVPISGYYEWKKTGDVRQAYYVTRADASIVLLAGLWERREAPGECSLESATIITTPPNVALSELHDRMPAVIEPESVGVWLDSAASPESLAALLAPAAAGLLRAHPVSSRVSNPKNDDPTLCERVEPMGLFG